MQEFLVRLHLHGSFRLTRTISEMFVVLDSLKSCLAKIHSDGVAFRIVVVGIKHENLGLVNP
jgi:hypothetical protein